MTAHTASSKERLYAAIDLKSFYASVECMDRGLDPLTTNLVVADKSRTEKTICLAVSPSLKSHGISGRARLFEVVQRVREVNIERLTHVPGRTFSGSSSDAAALALDPSLSIDYIVAPPRMARYIEVSSKIYNCYLQFIAPEDIHVYSIDEVFLDLTDYLPIYHLTPDELVKKMILEVLRNTGITATAGIAPNLYLCKIAMDLMAKHVPVDRDGVRIAHLDEASYRRQLWNHRPITDFWRVGPGYAKKLAQYGMYTMGDVARCSTGASSDFYNEDLLYKLFGVNAELLIDHAWGWEPCTIEAIKAYRPESSSLGSGQVLQYPYTYEKARIVVREMADALSLDLFSRHFVTDQLVLTIGYDIDNLSDPARRSAYHGEVTTDRYGRKVPKHGHGTIHLANFTSSSAEIIEAAMTLYDRITSPALLIRRLNLSADHVIPEDQVKKEETYEQLSLFSDPSKEKAEKIQKEASRERERRLQTAMLAIKNRYGKNAILRGTDLEDGATTMERNNQIGGHKA